MAYKTMICILVFIFTLMIEPEPAPAQRPARTDLPTSSDVLSSRSGPMRDRADAQHLNQEADRLQRITDIETELTRRNADHHLLMADLSTLLASAKQENAKKTQTRISDLINRREEQHKEQIRLLQQKLQRLKSSVLDLTQRRQAQHRVGTVAPPFSLNTYHGQSVSLSDYQDKIIVLEWFNPVCPFSKYYHRNRTLDQTVSQYAGQDVVRLSVNSTPSQNKQLTLDFIDQHNMTHSVLNDSDGKVARLYYVQATPQIVIIDKAGKIVYSGAIDNALSKSNDSTAVSFVDRALADVLAGRSVTLPYTVSTGTPVNSRIRP